MTTATILPGFTMPAAAVPVAGASTTNPSAAFGDLLSAFTGSQEQNGQQKAPVSGSVDLVPDLVADVAGGLDETVIQDQPSMGSTGIQGQLALFAPATAAPLAAPVQEKQDVPGDKSRTEEQPSLEITAAPVFDHQDDHRAEPQQQLQVPLPGAMTWPVQADVIQNSVIALTTPEVTAAAAQGAQVAAVAPASQASPVSAPFFSMPEWARAVAPTASTVAVQPAPAPVSIAAPEQPSAPHTPALPEVQAQGTSPAAIPAAISTPAQGHEPASFTQQLQVQPLQPEKVAAPAALNPAADAVEAPVEAAETGPVVTIPAGVPDTSRAAAPAAPSSPAPAAPQHQPMATQLAKPLFTLATETPGEHVMTLKVSPEDLGPVTVRAHISAEGVRLELFAAGDAGRDAVRNAMPELRRELAQQGLTASLDLSGRDSPGQGQPMGQQHRGGQDHGGPYRSNLRMVTEAEPTPGQTVRTMSGTAALDVVA